MPCPSPLSASRRLLGGTRMVSKVVAASRMFELVDGTLEKIGRETRALALPGFLRLLVAKAFDLTKEHPSIHEITKR